LSRLKIGPDLFHRTDPDSICLAQSPIDCAGLSDSHFSPVNERGHIGWICIAKSDESLTVAGFVNGSLEGPSGSSGVRKARNRSDMNTAAMPALGKPQQAGMGYIPATGQVFK